jgi:NADH-quinone oxidoreductase subunit L
VYDGFVRRVVVSGSEGLIWRRLDERVIDGAVNRAGTLTTALAEMLRPVETGFVRHYALVLLAGVIALVSYLLWA